jgi:hypothetical protein
MMVSAFTRGSTQYNARGFRVWRDGREAVDAARHTAFVLDQTRGRRAMHHDITKLE